MSIRNDDMNKIFSLRRDLQKFPASMDTIFFEFFDNVFQFNGKRELLDAINNIPKEGWYTGSETTLCHVIYGVEDDLSDYMDVYGWENAMNEPSIFVAASYSEVIISIPKASIYLQEIIRIYLDLYPNDMNVFLDTWPRLQQMNISALDWYKNLYWCHTHGSART